MKTLNFSSIYKYTVVVLLLTILIFLIIDVFQTPEESKSEQSEIGRYKEIRMPEYDFRGVIVGEQIKILDTKTGNYVN